MKANQTSHKDTSGNSVAENIGIENNSNENVVQQKSADNSIGQLKTDTSIPSGNNEKNNLPSRFPPIQLRTASEKGIVQREKEEGEAKEGEEKEEEEGVEIENIEFGEEAKKKTLYKRGNLEMFGEEPKGESSFSSKGLDTTIKEGGIESGTGLAIRKLTEASDTSIKEAFEVMAKAGVFGEAIASKKRETLDGTTMEATGKAGVSAGADAKAQTGVVIDVIEGLTLLASASGKAGLGFDLESLLQVSKEIGGIELQAKLASKIGGFVGVIASASGKFNYSATSISLEGKASVKAGAMSEGEITASVSANELAIQGKGSYEALAGASAEAEGKVELGLGGISAKGKAEAFAGAKIEGKLGANLSYKGKTLLKIGGKLEASAGVGGKIEGEFTFKDGKLVIGGSLAATLGLGGGGSLKVEVDFKEIGNAMLSIIIDALGGKALDRDDIADADRPKMKPDEDYNSVLAKLHSGVFNQLKDYAMHKEKLCKTTSWNPKHMAVDQGYQASILCRKEKVQAIFDLGLLRKAELSEITKYKISDGILIDILYQVLPNQVESKSDIDVHAGQIRKLKIIDAKQFRNNNGIK